MPSESLSRNLTYTDGSGVSSRYPWLNSCDDSVVWHRGQYGRDLVPLVEHVVFPELLQAPPHRLDVGAVIGAIRMVEVEPETETLAHLAPLVDVLVHRCLAARVELRDAELLDLLLAADLQRTLDLELDRESVGVPTGLSSHGEPGHLLVACEDVLVRARKDVVQTGEPVGGGRSLRRRRTAARRDAWPGCARRHGCAARVRGSRAPPRESPRAR